MASRPPEVQDVAGLSQMVAASRMRLASDAATGRELVAPVIDEDPGTGLTLTQEVNQIGIQLAAALATIADHEARIAALETP